MRQLLANLRHRPAPIVGILVALTVAASVVTWAFSVGEAGKNALVPAERLAATTIVVTGKPDVAFTSGSGQDATTDILPLTSYRRVPSTKATALGNIPGVRDAVADQSVPVALSLPNGQVATGTSAEPLTGYGWQSAVLTPFKLLSGHAPSASNQLVLGRGVARSTGLGVGDEIRLIGQSLPSFTIVGIAAAPAGDPAGTWTLFFSGPEAAALYGHPGEADLIGIVAGPGVSSAQLTSRVRGGALGTTPLGAEWEIPGDSRGCRRCERPVELVAIRWRCRHDYRAHLTLRRREYRRLLGRRAGAHDGPFARGRCHAGSGPAHDHG